MRQHNGKSIKKMQMNESYECVRFNNQKRDKEAPNLNQKKIESE